MKFCQWSVFRYRVLIVKRLCNYSLFILLKLSEGKVGQLIIFKLFQRYTLKSFNTWYYNVRTDSSIIDSVRFFLRFSCNVYRFPHSYVFDLVIEFYSLYIIIIYFDKTCRYTFFYTNIPITTISNVSSFVFSLGIYFIYIYIFTMVNFIFLLWLTFMKLTFFVISNDIYLLYWIIFMRKNFVFIFFITSHSPLYK